MIKLIKKIKIKISRIVANLYYTAKLKSFGRNSFIRSPLQIQGPKNISLGDNVFIGYKSWIAALPLTGAGTCELTFGDGCAIGNFNHIFATCSVVFGKKVLTADKVYVSDNLHSYENINLPVLEQPVKQIANVYIGDGTWLGENVCIIGASIGKNCVVGANAVVNKDIPDFCVAVGNPAKIIKRYCTETLIWKKTNPDGSFI